MNTWIALFRGINVGGHRKLPMKELVAELEKLGLSKVTTYIQSGNAIFRHEETSETALAEKIAQAIESSHGFLADVMVLSADAFRAAASDNPFPTSEATSKTVHLYFFTELLTEPKLSLLDEAQTTGEQYQLGQQVLYLHTPNGFRNSKLAQKVPRALGVPVTARNWRTVTKILELVERLN
ncbi:MAG: DUF1697 domain-containing protein [Gammaproteobacteria bacterium]|nr:DUF1697 domain-containing protein [Gammaproteobacteria bacterium]